MAWKDFDIYRLGTEIQLVGIIYQDRDQDYLVFCPEEHIKWKEGDREYSPMLLHLNADQWVEFLRQTDLLETQVLSHAGDGIVHKAILRKSQRQIDQSVSWSVYHRDEYRCRYCGLGDGAPMTVDHIITWEAGGPSIPQNLVCCCRKCNRERGQMPYKDWLESDLYKKRSAKLPQHIKDLNTLLLGELANIPLMVHKRKR